MLLWITACGGEEKDRTRDKLLWVKSIKKGATKDEVEKSRPDYVSIDWDNKVPDYEKSYRYKTNVTVKKGISTLHYQLRFRDEKFERIMVDIKIEPKKKKRSKK